MSYTSVIVRANRYELIGPEKLSSVHTSLQPQEVVRRDVYEVHVELVGRIAPNPYHYIFDGKPLSVSLSSATSSTSLCRTVELHPVANRHGVLRGEVRGRLLHPGERLVFEFTYDELHETLMLEHFEVETRERCDLQCCCQIQ